MGQFGGHNTHIDKVGSSRQFAGMAGLARVVVVGMPHHVTRRGNGRQETFFSDDDSGAYLKLMADRRGEEDVARLVR